MKENRSKHPKNSDNHSSDYRDIRVLQISQVFFFHKENAQFVKFRKIISTLDLIYLLQFTNENVVELNYFKYFNVPIVIAVK